jgi:hypothetical protein
LEVAYIKAHHHRTGRTTHYLNGVLLPPPHKVAIARYGDDEEVYLFYYDAVSEDEITDTWHESVEAARKHAEWEFGIRADEWSAV